MASGGPFPPTSSHGSRTVTPSDPNSNGTNSRPATICVYCGSATGSDPAHLDTARALGRAMAANKIRLVYGGGTVGLMGEIAKTIVSLSGPDSVHGIIPKALVKYERDPEYTSTHNGDAIGHEGGLAVPDEKLYGRTTVVEDMHTRKRMMAQEVLAGGPGSGFIALPGGFGTMEELFETITWNQLGIHDKGVCALNVNNFYTGLLDWIKKAVQEGFIKGGNADILVEATTADGAIRALREYRVSPSVYKLEWKSQ